MTEVEIPPFLIEALRVASDEATRFEAIIKDLRAAIEELMTDADAEYATVDGAKVIHWMHVRSRRLDTTKLKAAVDPALLASCYVESQSRRFTTLKAAAL